MAIQSSGENGSKNANNGISDLVFGEASNDTPLWKYGMLKSITLARDLARKSIGKNQFNMGFPNDSEETFGCVAYFDTLNDANDISAEPPTRSPMIPFHCSSSATERKIYRHKLQLY